MNEIIIYDHKNKTTKNIFNLNCYDTGVNTLKMT